MNARIAAALAGCLAVAAGTGGAMAQLTSGGGDLLIDADTLDIHNGEGFAVYEGRVDAAQGDTQIRTDRLELYFDQAGGGGGGVGGTMGDLDHAIAIGNVYYVTPTQIATGEHAYYDVKGDTVTLTGNVTVSQGCDVLKGEEVVLNLTTNDAQVRSAPGPNGEPGRVRTLIRDGDAGGAECVQ